VSKLDGTLKKRNLLPTAIFLAILATIGIVWGISSARNAELKRLEQIAEEQTRAAQEQEAARVARKKAHENLISMTKADFELAGQKCVAEISRRFIENKNYGWHFVDLDPYKFWTVKDASLLGLRATAAGSEASGNSLVTAQTERVMASIGDHSSDASMSFVISERVDSFGGLKEVLQLHRCSISSVDNVRIYESDRFIMN